MSRGTRYTEAQVREMERRFASVMGGYRPSPTPAERKIAAKPSKFRNVRVKTADGSFDSKAECARHGELKLLEKAGHITALQRQVRFRMTLITLDGPQHIEDYIADWTYFDVATRKFVVEDRKGAKTRDYLRKKRLMRELYGIEILES